MNGTIKIHFKTSAAAMRAAVDGIAWSGERYRSGRVKTWIAHVAKKTPYETAAEAAARFTPCGYQIGGLMSGQA